MLDIIKPILKQKLYWIYQMELEKYYASNVPPPHKHHLPAY